MNLDEIEVDQIPEFINYHDELNPRLWNDHKLKSDVRKHLIIITNKFIEFLDIPELKVQDVIIAGSNASYNYTKFSDIDLHLVVDMSFDDLAENLFNTKRNLWNLEHEVKIYGMDVELYVQESSSDLKSAGIYSLKNKWISIPKHKEPSVDDISIVSKVNQYQSSIDDLLESNPSDEEVESLLADIKKFRQSGLESGGEFSTENLSFKVLRNEGYINKLWDYLESKEDREMSLEGI